MHKPSYSIEHVLAAVLSVGCGIACMREFFQKTEAWAQLVIGSIFLVAAGLIFIEIADHYMFGSMSDREKQ